VQHDSQFKNGKQLTASTTADGLCISPVSNRGIAICCTSQTELARSLHVPQYVQMLYILQTRDNAVRVNCFPKVHV